MTALMLAAYEGHTEIVEALIKAEADVNIADEESTALMIAARKGHTKIVEALIDAKAVVDQGLWVGTTALMCAAENGHIKIVEALIKAEADVNIADEGTTALMIAAYGGHTKIVEALIEAGADLNKADKFGWTALLDAAQEGHTEIVKALIAAGADVNKANNYGRTALILAAQEGHTEIVKALIVAGARIPDSLKDNALVKKAVQHLEQVSQAFFNFIKPKRITSSTQKKVLVDHGYKILGNVAVPIKSMVLKKIRDLKKQGYRITALRNTAGNNVLHTVASLPSDSDVAKFFIYYYPALMNKANKSNETPFDAAVGAGPEMTKLFMEGMAAMPDAWKKRLWNSLSNRERQEAKALKNIILHGTASEAGKKNGELIP